MIVKELDRVAPASDVLAKAGRAAEEQMAFYLRRAFAGDARVRVLNDVRLEKNGDVAQIDHLVLSHWGVSIVESKSVTIRVRINEHGEWTRVFNGHSHGMPSPILQAKRQVEFLMSYLSDHAKELRDRKLLRPRDFSRTNFYIFVAISDSGIVDRPARLPVDEVCKADQVVDRIRGLMQQPRKAQNGLSGEELDRISGFLVDHHRPRPRVADSQAAGPEAAQKAPGTKKNTVVWGKSNKMQCCRHCGSTDVSVQSGRYGYYYRCEQCTKNTHIVTRCARCGCEETVRRNGRYYLADCKTCAISTVFFPPVPIEQSAM